MNMLVIGNGFDLAHGRPTKYEDFLRFTEQIKRIPVFQSDKNRFEESLPSTLHPGVKEYILTAFEKRVWSVARNLYISQNDMVQEMYDCLEENVWHDYFQEIVKNDQMRGKNWIDFEFEILEVIRFFDEKFPDDLHNQFDQFILQEKENSNLIGKIGKFSSALKFQKYNYNKQRPINHPVNLLEFIEKTYQDLEKLIRCLEIYLDDCVAKIPITCYSPDIQGLECGSILSFNYTEIPTKIYPSLTNVHYIHGFAEVKRPAAENNMVLGVNEYRKGDDRNTQTNFNLYKKFVQRIIKETGIGYKSTLAHMLSSYDESKQRYVQTKGYTGLINNNIYIFGHSLDITDEDILKEIIRTDGVVTTIFYKDKQQQANQIANLSKVLGQDELLKRTFSTSPSIIFQQQAEMVPV